jgi:hypothetical protein
MKTLPLSVFILVLLPLVALPTVGEGSLIHQSNDEMVGKWWQPSTWGEKDKEQNSTITEIVNQILDRIMDIPELVWNFFVEKVSLLVEKTSTFLIDSLVEMKELHNDFLSSFIDVNSSWQYQTASLILTTLYILFLMGLVRVWVLVLDVAPIF